MNRRVLFPVLLIVISTWAAGQSYGPPGISTTLPTTTAIAPPLTPSAGAIPITPSTNPLVFSPSVNTLPTTTAVLPPIEAAPDQRMDLAFKNAYSSSATAEGVAGAFFNPGVISARAVEDGTNGRSLGSIARERRKCTPSVTGIKFTNDDFERTDGGEVPTLVKNVCRE